MSLDLGTAWIQISPSFKGVRRAVEKELGSVNTSKFSGGLVGSIATVAKAGGAAVAGLGAAVVGLAAKGGFARALSIEQSQVKLTGLGHDAESVSRIMESALASVKGTAYGLGDAATVAASMSAAGIESGNELTSVLTTIADTAQISGRSMVDVGNIFGSVAARGKLQGDDMLQLMSAGVPVLKFLSEQLGVTTADVSEMVSRGEIDFQTFADAMEAGLGGAAQSAGDSFTGAWANVQAALGRIGEFGATPILQGLRDVFNELIPVIDGAAASMEPFFAAFSERTAATVERVTDALGGVADRLEGGIQLPNLGPYMAGLAPLLGMGAGSLGGALGGLPVIGGLFSGITPLFGALAGAVGVMLANSEPLRDALAGVGQSLTDGLAAVLPGLVDLLPAFGEVLGSLGDAVAPIIANLGETLVPILLEAIPLIGDVLGVALGAIGGVVDWLAGNGDVATAVVMGLLGAFTGLKVLNIAKMIGGIFPLLVGGIKGIGAAMSANPLGLIIAAVAGLVAAFVWAYNNIEPFRDFVDGVWAKIKEVAQAVADWFIEDFVGFFRRAWDAITGFFESGRDGVLGIVDAIKGFFSGIGDAFSAAGDKIGEIWDVILGWFQSAGDWISGTFGPIWDQVHAILTLPINLAKTIIELAWDWITDKFSAAWEWVSTTFGAAWAGLKDLLSGPIDAAKTWIENTWSLIIGAFTTAWSNVTGWVSGKWDTLTGLIGSVLDRAKDWIANAWDAIVTGFGTFWGNVTEWVSSKWNTLTGLLRGPVDKAKEWIDTAIGGIKSAFDEAVTFIADIWDGLIEAVKKPIRFVMVTVIDEGLIAGFNKIADFAGSSRLSTITPAGFAAGGYVDLPWSASNRDPYLGTTPNGLFRFEGEEFIVNRDATRRNRGLLEAINADRFQDGGFLGGITSGLTSAASGVLDFIRDPKSALTGIIDRLLGTVASNPILSLMVGIPRKIASVLAEWVKSKLVPEAIPGGAWSGGLPAAGVITSGYGFRYGPFNGAEHHDGIDIGAPLGTPVHSMLPGVVDYAGWFGGYGNTVGVTSGSARMFYAHLASVLVAVGQLVKAGQIVGLVGSTGWSTGPHLHWGASMNGASVNPTSFGGYASGTASARRGLAWVGEQGPELVDFRGGERVWSARQSRDMAALPDRITLVAEDGTMLGVFRTVAGDVVRTALAPASSGALTSRLGGV